MMQIIQISEMAKVNFGNSLKIFLFAVYPFTNSGNKTNGAIQKVSTKTVDVVVARGLKNLGNKLSPTMM